jgi:hypothetical protein
MNPLTTFDAPALPAADLEIAKNFARASKATATRRVYQKDFARFTSVRPATYSTHPSGP